MQRIKALYVAVAIGVAAAVVAVPIVVRRLANVWPSPEIAPARTAGGVPVLPPPASASAQPNPPVPALPTLASPAVISPETIPTSNRLDELERSWYASDWLSGNYHGRRCCRPTLVRSFIL